MFDFETALTGIDYKVRQLIDENNGLKAKVMELNETIEEQKEQIVNLNSEIKQLTEETQILKLRNTLVSKGVSTEIKLKINQMIRNIDKCLSLLNQVE